MEAMILTRMAVCVLGYITGTAIMILAGIINNPEPDKLIGISCLILYVACFILGVYYYNFFSDEQERLG